MNKRMIRILASLAILVAVILLMGRSIFKSDSTIGDSASLKEGQQLPNTLSDIQIGVAERQNESKIVVGTAVESTIEIEGQVYRVEFEDDALSEEEYALISQDLSNLVGFRRSEIETVNPERIYTLPFAGRRVEVNFELVFPIEGRSRNYILSPIILEATNQRLLRAYLVAITDFGGSQSFTIPRSLSDIYLDQIAFTERNQIAFNELMVFIERLNNLESEISAKSALVELLEFGPDTNQVRDQISELSEEEARFSLNMLSGTYNSNVSLLDFAPVELAFGDGPAQQEYSGVLVARVDVKDASDQVQSQDIELIFSEGKWRLSRVI